eukprot:537338-Alexandrium_andersonii.AAC.1
MRHSAPVGDNRAVSVMVCSVARARLHSKRRTAGAEVLTLVLTKSPSGPRRRASMRSGDCSAEAS